MSSRETGQCALKCLVLDGKICTSMRMYHVEEAAVEMSFKVKRRAGARKFTFRFVSEPSWRLWGYLYPPPAPLIERRRVWSWGPKQNFHGWWIYVCSSHLILISNALLFNGVSAVQFKGLSQKWRGELYINFILQNRIRDRKQCRRQMAGIYSPQPCSGTGRSPPLLF